MRPTHFKFVLAFLAGVMLLFSCRQESVNPKTGNLVDTTGNPVPQPKDTTPKPRPPIRESPLVTSANNFAFRLFGALQTKQQNQNLFISPLSISTVLAMVFNGAAGTTKEAMRQTLEFGTQPNEEINQAFKTLQITLAAQDQQVTLTSANALWHHQVWQLQPEFLQLNKNYFGATIQALNFKAPGTPDLMNKWAAEKTQGKIDKIVAKVPDDAIMMLVNAIYFKAAWTYPFEPYGTRKGHFYKNDGSTMQADFMIRYNGKYLYYHDADRTLVDIPYGNTQYSMTVIMPTAPAKVNDLAQKITNSELNNWLNKSDTTRMALRLPRFKIEYQKKLNEALTQLGMGIAFSDEADFSRMLTGTQRSKLSEVGQKTFVVVNEEGTEAAAVTTAVTVPTSAPPTMLIDRPFIFLIREKSTNAIIFIGQLMDP